MNFKDHVAQDIANVFFNTDEFSDLVTIDGQECTVQIDSDRLIKRSEKEYNGITAGIILYFIPVLDYPNKPKVGNTQIFNNKLHFIDSVLESDGVYEIVINQNRGE
ncbi:hypothetical protein EHS13_20310 [Paenibacillus psychroresistens]|uniref:Uncharacterized protein n=1 Tax=Paenibacillus psychroresistens TaxID=1778678 RepID=A0A6B8RNE8_9BACL|nr:hypothetical protein [Paenibacillus psychroresistens]QGQ97063.1 hypothetical protein EHS13_20310 [Paenibacillus psychroresistens]